MVPAGDGQWMTFVRLHFLRRQVLVALAILAISVALFLKVDVSRIALLAALGYLAVSILAMFWLARIELVAALLVPIGLSQLVTLGILRLAGIHSPRLYGFAILLTFGWGIAFSGDRLAADLGAYRGLCRPRTRRELVPSAIVVLCGLITLLVIDGRSLALLGVAGMIALCASILAAVAVVPAITSRLLPRERTFPAPSAKGLLHGAGVGLYLVVGSLLYLLLVRPLGVLRFRHDRTRRTLWARRYLHAMGGWLSRNWPYSGSERIWLNIDAAALNKPSVIVANHLSIFDIMVVFSLSPRLVMVSKARLLRFPIANLIARDLGHIIAGDGDAETVIQQGLDRLREGVSVVFFPEGTRSRDGQIHRFHNGAFELALRAGCEITPLLLTNTDAAVYAGTQWVGDHRCIVRVLPSIVPDSDAASAGPRVLARHVRQRMIEQQAVDWRLAQDGPVLARYVRALYRYQGRAVEREIARQLRTDALCEMIDNIVPFDGQILVVPCGYGVLCHILARKSLRRQVLGVDHRAECVRVARSSARAAQRVRFELADPPAWGFPAADCVVLTDGLHEWNEQDRQRIVDELLRRLRPGGTVVYRDGLPATARQSCRQMLEDCGLALESPTTDTRTGDSGVKVFRKPEIPCGTI